MTMDLRVCILWDVRVWYAYHFSHTGGKEGKKQSVGVRVETATRAAARAAAVAA